MAIKPRLELRQSQQLAMTPQLQQAIKLLQLSQFELANYLQEQLEKNPLLETDSNSDTFDGSTNSANETISDNASQNSDSSETDSNVESEPVGELSLNDFSESTNNDLDGGQDNLFSDQQSETPAVTTGDESFSYKSLSGGGGSFEGSDFNLEQILGHELTLVEHLTQQLMVNIKDPTMRMVGQQLIHLIDEDGYLRTELEDVADQLGVDSDLMEQVIAELQLFEPTGVFSRNLSECLALQLKEKNRYDPAMQALIENIEMLARREFSALKKICRIDDEDLTAMIGEIRELDPRPGLQFESHFAEPVVPDVQVKANSDGSWHVELCANALPRILVNQNYYAVISSSVKDDEGKAYISECLQDANWLVRSLDQRARTILKVASEIVKQQDAFFAYGVQHLKPLTLKNVADAIDMHESTVSRVTSNKYVETPRGIFEFKFFFTASISSTGGGDALSAESVRYKIKQLIDEESPSAVLSDDQLVQMLRNDGVDIARRTVAKYRESLKIPSSVQRRREKRLLA